MDKDKTVNVFSLAAMALAMSIDNFPLRTPPTRSLKNRKPDKKKKKKRKDAKVSKRKNR